MQAAQLVVLALGLEVLVIVGLPLVASELAARVRELAPEPGDQVLEMVLELWEPAHQPGVVPSQEPDWARRSSVGTKGMAPPHQLGLLGW